MPGSYSSRRLRVVILALVAGLLGVAVWLKLRDDTAQNHFAEGRAALDRDDPAEALRHFELGLAIRSKSGEGCFLAARASRRSGDANVAKGFLKRAEANGHAASEIESERALIFAQSGYMAEAEPIFAKHIRDNGPDSAEMIALLAPSYMAQFRVVEAGALTGKWVELRPASAPAWTLHADVLERLRKKPQALAALRQLILLAPENRAARLNLVRMLVETRQSLDEAVLHAEWLTATGPDDMPAHVQLAACREWQGRPDDAAALLDRVIAGPGPSAKSLHLRGRLEMNRNRPTVALGFLKRGADVDPSDVELLYSLFQCVQQTGTPAEARLAEERWRNCDADLRRVAVLSRAISAAPKDVELRREIGELFLRNGREAEGLRWLDSALALEPQHRPSHKVLADHYERIGNIDLARRHASFAKSD